MARGGSGGEQPRFATGASGWFDLPPGSAFLSCDATLQAGAFWSTTPAAMAIRIGIIQMRDTLLPRARCVTLRTVGRSGGIHDASEFPDKIVQSHLTQWQQSKKASKGFTLGDYVL